MVEMKKNGIIYFRRVTYRPTLRVYFYIPTNVIARRALPDVAISCWTTGDPHVASLLGMTL